MIYTDKIHLVADTVNELHAFAQRIGLARCWFEGTKKGHPHYDLVNRKNIPLYNFALKKKYIDLALENGAVVVDPRRIPEISKNSLKNTTQPSLFAV